MKKETEDIINKLRNDPNRKESGGNDSLDSDIDWKHEADRLNLEILKKIEKQKIKLRDKLVNAVKHVIWFQLVFFNIIILAIVLAVTSKIPLFKDIDIELSIQLFGFLKYYISATIVELLGMLVFILHYVFSDIRFGKKLLEESKKKLN